MNQPVNIMLPARREERFALLDEHFPDAQGPDLSDIWHGGRQSALQRLSQVDAMAYAQSRNHLTGAVTQLSPYIRHGCLSLNEVIATVLDRFGRDAVKLVSELAYHDYFRQVWYRFGEAIERNLEHPKVLTGQASLPAFMDQGITGLVCMDEMVRALKQEGYLHNHARMWIAAYIVHWLKIDWREAVSWFESYLLDGNIASNHLSWQWVTSSFSHKPYIFNKENIMKFGGEHWCQQCRVRCPFDDSYENLSLQLFPATSEKQQSFTVQAVRPQTMKDHAMPIEVVWVHDEMLSPTQPLLANNLPALFIFDPQHYGRWPLKRLQFMADCLAEMPNVAVWIGDTQTIFTTLGYRSIQTQRTPQTTLIKSVQPLNVEWVNEPALYPDSLSTDQLMRFSRYWKKVGPSIMGDFYPD